jgi:Tol biopolymer transport system component
VTFTAAGGQVDGDISAEASMTPDARFVVFSSSSPNVAPGAAGGTGSFVDLRDRTHATTELVSRAVDGGPPNGNSANGFGPPVISADGRYVAFASLASNLVAGDTNGTVDVFVRDRAAGVTRRVSVASDTAQANGASTNPSISADGRYVAFQSQASNLVADDHTPFVTDVFVHDLQTGATVRASVGLGGVDANGASSVKFDAVSDDGRYVAFTSQATNLVASDANGTTTDVFVRDLVAGTTELVSLTSAGTQSVGGTSNALISGNGRYAVFQGGTGIVPGQGITTAIFVRDRAEGTVHEASVWTTGAEVGSAVFLGGISADGLHVSFSTNACAPGLACSGVFDFYVHDVATGTTDRVSVADSGATANDSSITSGQTVGGDGRRVLFASTATNLVSGDSNLRRDLFIRDRGVLDAAAPEIACGSPDGSWHAGDVSIACTASDAGSGLAHAGDASFSVSTSVAGGTEDAAAVTGTREVCDAAGNCATAGPLGPIMVDRRPPTMALVGRTPANAEGWNDGAVTLEWSCDDGGSGAVAPSVTATVATEGVDQAVTGTCTDNVGNSSSETRTGIDVDATPPVVEAPVVAANPKPVGLSTSVTAVASDALSGLAGGELYLGPDPGAGHGTALTLLGSTLSGAIEGSLAAGVYPLCARARDRAGNWGDAACTFLVVYDPNGAFVTGSGRLDSPAGAYKPDPSFSGRAQLGFVTKYKPGATIPTGNTRFEFDVAGLDFRSESYDWLVVAGARAQFKGTGTINGAGAYGFMVTAIDGEVAGAGGVDRVRIKIWDESNGDAVVYDNESGADETTALVGGSVAIHKAGG